ncbi:MAG: glycoside hydrolase, partial [Candidatus Thermoplasmatota archaeon]|nr:glycoside hydrolase [Candidatus Thermoplasmatota archaeon]
MTMGAEIGTDSAGVRRRYIAVVIAVVCLGLAGMPYSHSFAGHGEASDVELPERILDENGNLIATMSDPSQTRREVSPDMLQTFGPPVETVRAGQENLRVLSRDEPIPSGLPFLGEVPLYVNGSSEDTAPRIAHNPIDGYTWAVFSHNDGLDTDVYVSYSIDLGQTWNLTLSTTGPYNETNPAIAIAGNTVFISYEQDKIGWEQNTFFIMSQDGGQTWGTYYINWDWTNPYPGVQLEDFNNVDVSAVRPGWFHWIADVYAVKNATRTVAFMWTDNGGTSWSMGYLTHSLHRGEDLEHPVIMENSADELMHMAYQHWNTSEASWDVEWLSVDHGWSYVTGYWTANIDGGRSDIAPDLYVRDDYVYVIWQNGTFPAELTAF